MFAPYGLAVGVLVSVLLGVSLASGVSDNVGLGNVVSVSLGIAVAHSVALGNGKSVAVLVLEMVLVKLGVNVALGSKVSLGGIDVCVAAGLAVMVFVLVIVTNNVGEFSGVMLLEIVTLGEGDGLMSAS